MITEFRWNKILCCSLDDGLTMRENSLNLQSTNGTGIMETTKPTLFGQKHSSRDYSDPAFWGKNQFNSSFPASLLAYMSYKRVRPVYIKYSDGATIHDYLDASAVLGIDPLSDNAFYNYEAGFAPYEQFYSGKRENIDLVMLDNLNNRLLRGLEIKLTALPDNTTKSLTEEQYSSEIVVRPPTICFIACSICMNYRNDQSIIRLRNLLSGVPQINHWEEADEVSQYYPEIEAAVLRVCSDMSVQQQPIMVQPIWKTQGLKPILANDCLDIFVWSNLAVLMMCISDGANRNHDINRFQRTIIWVYRMLFDYVTYGSFDYMRIIKNHSYGRANDKAFAMTGLRTHKFLACDELTHPRINKNEIKNIILGGGQDLLSPERRFDAAIAASPDLFL